MPRRISLYPSRRLAAGLGVAHALAAVAVFAAGLAAPLALALLLAIGASLARCRASSAATGLVLHDDGRLQTVSAGGAVDEAQVLSGSVVTAALVVLRYRQSGRQRALVLPGDALSPDDGRELRCWLRWVRVADGEARDDADAGPSRGHAAGSRDSPG